MNKYKFLICFILLCSSSFIGFAQAKQETFVIKNYTTKEGLSNNASYCILQDHVGYIWIGTDDGLNRFDGKLFKVYRNDPNNPASLSLNMISSMLEDRDHNLWIGTKGGGLCRYDRLQDHFITYAYDPNDSFSLSHQQIAAIYQDKEGTLWIGTDGGGLNKLDPSTGKFTRYSNLIPLKGGFSSLKILSICDDNHGNLLIGTWDGGMNVFNKKQGEVTAVYTSNPGKPGLPTNHVWSIIPALNDHFWIGLFGSGINYFNVSENSFSLLPFPGKIADPTVYSLLTLNNHEIWMATNAGLYYGTFSYVNKKPIFNKDFKRISDFLTVSVMVDQEGSIWANTIDNGIVHVWRKNPNFTPHFIDIEGKHANLSYLYINGFAEDPDKTIWISTNQGLFRYDPKTDRSEFIQEPKQQRILDLKIDKDGILWAGRDKDIARLNPKLKQLESFYSLPDSIAKVKQPEYRALLLESDENWWLGTGNGLFLLDKKNNCLKTVIKPGQVHNGLNIFQIQSICRDSSHAIYIATMGGGLVVSDSSGDSLRFYQNDPENPSSLASNKLNQVFISSSGTIWISGYNGLDKYDKTKGTFKHFSTRIGFPAKILYSIREDRSGHLWISNPGGISRLDTTKREVANFFFYEAESHNSYSMASIFTIEGKMYFGQRGSFVLFNPDSIDVRMNKRRLLITDFNLNNNNVVPIRNSIQRNGDTIGRIFLSYKQSSFSLNFAALNFVSPESNLYHYELVPFQEEWTFAGNNTTASYTNIPPGTYNFKVRAFSQAGLVSDTNTDVIIVIEPPFWKTWWFRILVTGLLIGLIFLGYYIRLWNISKEKRKLARLVSERTSELSQVNVLLEEQKEELEHQKEELQQQKEELSISQEMLAESKSHLEVQVKERTAELELAKDKAEESDRLKSAFLANMSHEIRTPLNAIVGFSNLITNPNISEQDKKFYTGIINSNSDSLLVLVDDIIDLSKIEAQQIQLNVTSFSANQFMKEVYEQFQAHVSPKIQFILDEIINQEDVIIKSDHIRFRQVLTNLLTNAFKFTDEGSVQMGFRISGEEEVTFYVKDSGIGVAPENQQLIFERFRKVEHEQKLFRGAGLGLAICQRIIHLLGGKIWVESTVGVGAAFYFTQPLYNHSHAHQPEKSMKEPEINRAVEPNKKTIAICEDEEGNYLLLREYLKRLGIATIWFRNGQEFVRHVESHTDLGFSLVLMDIKMPDMNGFDAAAYLWKKHPGFPVIAQTAYALNNEISRIMQGGFAANLTKPIRIEDLQNVLRNYLRQ
jgi:signal transduction histidine kinase/ligand-binding sensor domain-containing protein/CheY-like chemotaxis protein